MEKAIVEIWGITLSEPLTFLSDTVLAVFAFVFYFRLKEQGNINTSDIRFNRFFLFLSISTFFGGLAHLTGMYFSHNYMHVFAWSIMAIAMYNYEAAMASQLSKKWYNVVKWSSLTRALLFVVVAVIYQEVGPEPVISRLVGVKGFFITSIYMAFGFIAVILPIAFRSFYYGNRTGDGLIMLGIILLSSTLIVRKSELSFSRHFNYNEISHVILLAVFYVFFLGMRKKISESQNELEVS